MMITAESKFTAKRHPRAIEILRVDWIASLTDVPSEEEPVHLKLTSRPLGQRERSLRIQMTAHEARTLGQVLIHLGGEDATR